jgi:hypothetical protein
LRDFANADWTIRKTPEGNPDHITSVAALLAVLMDIREELRRLNETLYVRPPDTIADIVTAHQIRKNQRGTGEKTT